MKIVYEQIICSLFLWFKTPPATKPKYVFEKVPSNTIVWSCKNEIIPFPYTKYSHLGRGSKTLREVVHKFIVILFWEIFPTHKPEYSLSVSSLSLFFFPFFSFPPLAEHLNLLQELPGS